MLLLVNSVGKKKSIKNGKEDARLHCIFENGTESTMLLRSLGKALRENKTGRVVSERVDKTNKRLSTVTEEDTKTGYIYIAKSLSKDLKIQSISHLYKV